MVLSLSELPPEVLAQILDGPLSFAAVELWQTGDSSLRSKLTRKGIRHMDLRHARPKSAATWPKCLKEFHLLSLRLVNRFGTLKELPTLHRELKQLKSGLEHLELRFFDAGLVFFYDALKSDLSVLPPSKRRIFTESEVGAAGSDSSTGELAPFSETQASLKHLIVDDIESTNSVLHDGLFASLPPNLTCLNVGGLRIGRPLNDFSHLPAGITQLTLPLRTINATNIRSLPSRLVTVGHCFSFDALALLNEEPSILPNLLQFPHDGIFSSFDDSAITVRGKAKKWPANLLTLQFIGDATRDYFEELPPRLARLDLSVTTAVVNSNWIQRSLPSSLTSLTVDWIDWKDVSASLRWPPNLTALFCSITHESSEDIYHRLPRSLKTLSLGRTPRVDGPQAVELDMEDMDALLIRGQRVIDEFENQSWTSLQTELQSQCTEGVWRNWCPTFIDKVSGGALLGLPLGITDLKLSGLITHHAANLLLPPRITKLHLNDVRIWQTALFFELLPPSLTHLSLSDIVGQAKDMDVTQWPLVKVPSPSASALYHLNLETVMMAFSRLHGIHLILPLLPPNLKYIDMDTFGLDAEVLEHLPSVKSLVLRSPLSSKEKWVKHLPRSLESLELKNSRIQLQGSELADLPPNLTYLEGALARVCLDHLLTLPRSLATLNCSKFLIGGDGGLLLDQFGALLREFIPLWRIKHTPRADIEALLQTIKAQAKPTRFL